MLTEYDLTWQFKENENLLFHYTSYFKGLSILESNSLWAGQLSGMNDPLEFRPVGQEFSWSGDVSNDKVYSKMTELQKANKKRNDTIRLLSFSVDDFYLNDEVFSKQVAFDNMLNHGWARTRMWAQYGDCHKGICFVFDKEKLIEASKKYSEVQTFFGKIEYTNDMSGFHNAFDLDFTEKDFEKDHTNIFLQEDKRRFLFQKCDDFMAEQEFRVLFISNIFDNNKPFIFDYRDSLVGIIISDCFDSLNLPAIKNIANKKDIPIFQLMWRYGTPTLYKEPIKNDENLTQLMIIAKEIQLFLQVEKSKGNEYVTLKCSKIRKWQKVDAVCANHNSRNICHAMKKVSGALIVEQSGTYESSSYTAKYKLL